jgi:hypothetical protein
MTRQQTFVFSVQNIHLYAYHTSLLLILSESSFQNYRCHSVCNPFTQVYIEEKRHSRCRGGRLTIKSRRPHFIIFGKQACRRRVTAALPYLLPDMSG